MDKRKRVLASCGMTSSNLPPDNFQDREKSGPNPLLNLPVLFTKSTISRGCERYPFSTSRRGVRGEGLPFFHFTILRHNH